MQVKLLLVLGAALFPLLEAAPVTGHLQTRTSEEDSTMVLYDHDKAKREEDADMVLYDHDKAKREEDTVMVLYDHDKAKREEDADMVLYDHDKREEGAFNADFADK